MSRNLVICCDGTNNQFGTNNTNVVRLIQALERDSAKQRLYYDPGVGTLPEPGAWTWLEKKISDLFGLAVGGGLNWKVEEAYSYLMEYWEPDDKVFLFGFSRGAYTVRVLAGLLHSLGLLPRGNQNLVPYVMRLFKAVRGDSTYWKLCNAFRQTFARPVPGVDKRHFKVHFLGVWDTVSSVGWIWDPVTFPFTARNPSIDTICHAVSLDERRWFFRQNLVRRADRKREKPQTIKEVWFPGVHCDVGGGYPTDDSRLWHEPFKWMLSEAAAAGLYVDSQRLNDILQNSAKSPRNWSANPWTDEKHESLTWKWWIAEFFPKLQARRKLEGSTWKYTSYKVPKLGLFGNREMEERAVLHSSTLRRIREDDSYRPRNLSEAFIETVRALPVVPDILPFERDAASAPTMRVSGA